MFRHEDGEPAADYADYANGAQKIILDAPHLRNSRNPRLVPIYPDAVNHFHQDSLRVVMRARQASILDSSWFISMGFNRKSKAPSLNACRTISRSAKALMRITPTSLLRLLSSLRVSIPPIAGMTSSIKTIDMDASRSRISKAVFPL